MNNTNRIQDLREVSAMASREGRHDIVEQIYIEIQELEAKDNVVEMNHVYVQTTPADQILSNQINNLIAYFGRDKTEAMFQIIFPTK